MTQKNVPANMERVNAHSSYQKSLGINRHLALAQVTRSALATKPLISFCFSNEQELLGNDSKSHMEERETSNILGVNKELIKNGKKGLSCKESCHGHQKAQE